MIKLSVIVPVYNVENYLPKCLDSILNQSFRDFELLLINDGSTDKSGEICNSYQEKDERIRVVTQKNKGLSAARNAGIKLAKGTYLSFIDSDDWIDENMYLDMLEAADSHKDGYDIVICGHRVVSEQGDVLESNSVENMEMDSVKATSLLLEDELFPSFAWNKLFKATLFSSIEFPVGKYYEDTACIYKVCHIAKSVKNISGIYYNYLRRSNSICLNSDIEKQIKRTVDNYQAFYERYNFVKRNTQYLSVLHICAKKTVLLGFNVLNGNIRYNYNLSNGFCNMVRNQIVNASIDAKLDFATKTKVFMVHYLYGLYKVLLKAKYLF